MDIPYTWHGTDQSVPFYGGVPRNEPILVDFGKCGIHCVTYDGISFYVTDLKNGEIPRYQESDVVAWMPLPLSVFYGQREEERA